MAFTRATAKAVVRDSLREVADVRSDNIEHFTFRHFHPYHRTVFLSALMVIVLQVLYRDAGYYDLILHDDSIKLWPTVGDCIDWVFHNKKLRRSQNHVLSRAELEG